MSLLTLLVVGCVGGIGAVARLVLDGSISDRLGRDFPYGTLVVNVAGAFVLGLLAGLALDKNAYRVAGTGLIGAFTTFSTWTLESHRLGEAGERRLGAANFAVSLILGLAAAWVGRQVGIAL